MSDLLCMHVVDLYPHVSYVENCSYFFCVLIDVFRRRLSCAFYSCQLFLSFVCLWTSCELKEGDV